MGRGSLTREIKTERHLNSHNLKGLVARIERFMIHDGPGIRTVIFMKGCPLRCIWCSSPQMWNPFPEVVFVKGKCIECDSCLGACSENAIVARKDRKRIDREKCNKCGKCVEVCPTGALKFDGSLMLLQEVMKIVMRDEQFYQSSGGGVTVSGGEPTMQPEFVTEVLEKCQERGIHTALETSGFVEWEKLKEILRFVDVLLQDIKHMDPVKHLNLTGQRNELILENIQRVVKEKLSPIIIRFPVIPNHNDSMDSIGALLDFMGKLNLDKIDIFPFHKLGEHEYEELGFECKAKDLQVRTPDRMLKIKEIVKSRGLEIVS